MKWFWAVSCDNAQENPFVADTVEPEDFDENSLMQGKLINEWSPQVCLRAEEMENDGEADDVLQNLLGLPIYSLRLRQSLTDAGISEIQYLPVKVFRPTGALLGDFAIANILALVPALELSKSDFDTFPADYFLPERRGTVRGIRKAVLRAGEIKGHDIIRLQESRSSIYVSETFRRCFELRRFTGYSFHEVPVV